MPELHDLSALDQAAAIRGGTVSPTELVEHYLARIAAHSDTVGAFVTVTGDTALAQAAEATTRVLDARRNGATAALPPLLGVPTAIKDLTLTAGVPTKLGSLAFADLVPPVDDHVVTLLRAAGTISLGKTNTPELGAPCYTEPDPSIAPPARTPWDLTRSAGGSSGGAAAAVATGLVPFAQGSDGGGSVRIPASVTGLVGIKVSRGRVSNGPLGGDLNGLAWNGPLARTVADAAAMLDAMAVVPPYREPDMAAPPPARAARSARCGRAATWAMCSTPRCTTTAGRPGSGPLTRSPPSATTSSTSRRPRSAACSTPSWSSGEWGSPPPRSPPTGRSCCAR
jgi:amidase